MRFLYKLPLVIRNIYLLIMRRTIGTHGAKSRYLYLKSKGVKGVRYDNTSCNDDVVSDIAKKLRGE